VNIISHSEIYDETEGKLKAWVANESDKGVRSGWMYLDELKQAHESIGRSIEVLERIQAQHKAEAKVRQEAIDVARLSTLIAGVNFPSTGNVARAIYEAGWRNVGNETEREALK
jgi:hypothetical protein